MRGKQAGQREVAGNFAEVFTGEEAGGLMEWALARKVKKRVKCGGRGAGMH
jgi:hypothetical protein